MGISDKVPGSMNPPSPLQNMEFDGILTTKSPKVDYAMNLPGQETSPLQMLGGENKHTTLREPGPGVSGAINPGKNVNLGDGSSGKAGGNGYIPA